MKNKQKGFIVPLLIILLALSVGGGIYFYLKSKSLNYKPENQTTENSAQTTQNVTTTTTDPTINWKTYSNTQFGFQFKYPSDFPSLTVYSVGNGLAGITYESASPTRPTTSTDISKRPGLSLNIVEKTGNIQTDINNYKTGMTGISAADCLSTAVITYTMVAGEQAVRTDCVNPKSIMGVTFGSTTGVNFYHEKYQFLIGTTGFSPSDDVLGEIIKSFSFTK